MNKSLFANHICVTGSIGSGKSRVVRFLAKCLHLPYIDIDEIARKIMNRNGEGLRVIGDYNSDYIQDDGLLDRSLLRNDIFNDPQVKKDIDSLLHPLIQSALTVRLQDEKEKTIIEIPLVFETGWDHLFDIIIVVAASRETCLKRIMTRDYVTSTDAAKAYDSQMDIAVKKEKASFVIENDGDWADNTIENIRGIALKLR